MGVALDTLERVVGETTIVSRLRVRHPVSDTLAARLRLGNLLSAVNLCPPGLAPSAIVCIKRLQDPLPGAISLQNYGARVPEAWQQRTLAAVERLIQSASRPARDTVPANAESIIFADHSELLACLAHDWLEGRALAESWWWQSLYKNEEMAQLVLRLWQDAPAHVPGALQLLSDKRSAMAFVRRLSAADASGLLHRVLHRFALPKLLAAIRANEESHQATRDSARRRMNEGATSAPTRESVSARHLFDGRDAPVEPWGRWVFETGSDLSPEQKCLLGIALLLQRAPAVARSTAFAAEVEGWRLAWMRRARLERAALPNTTSAASSRPPVKTRRESTLSQVGEAQPGSEVSIVGASATRREADESDAIEASHERALENPISASESPKMQTGASHAVAERQGEESEAVAAFESALSKEVDGAENSPPPAPQLSVKDARTPEQSESAPASEAFAVEQEPDTSASFEKVFETGFGGVFYLVNLSLFLNLYGDFAQPHEHDIALNVWDFVALLGRELSGARIESDPVWSLLSHLAGRDETSDAGQDFSPPDEWRVPREWLETFQGAQSWQWLVIEERLLVWHPAGFFVLNVPRTEESSEAQLLRELKNYEAASARCERGSLDELMPAIAGQSLKEVAPLKRWLARVSAYARARLQQALGLDEGKELAELLLERRATVYVTTTHVDVMFSLSDIPFEVRLSGLDRDPGWVPAAGRFIAFHFV